MPDLKNATRTTANIQPHFSNQLIPAHGVYCVDAIIEDSYYTGMCNIGNRPTFFENGEDIIEVHFFSEDPFNSKKQPVPHVPLPIRSPGYNGVP